jgi:hypothetical protein
MTLPHIFISHAGADTVTATTLAEHLRNAGHETQIDSASLNLGSNSIAFMNQGIGKAHTIVILLSQHSQSAVWQLAEIDAAIWNEIAQSGGRCIVVRLDDTPVPPLLGPKVYGKLDPGDQSSFGKLIEAICKVAIPTPNVSGVISEALRPSSQNPFRFLRAEFFEDRPDLHAKTFAPPDALKVGALNEIKPCFLEGSRGTGKSMLLLSLRARNYRLRRRANSKLACVFGFYVKLSRGAICNVGTALGSDLELLAPSGLAMAQIQDIAAQEIIILLLESLFSELSYCIAYESLLECQKPVEKALANAADGLLFDNVTDCASTIDELLEKLGDAHKRIANFIRRRFIYGEQPTVPFGTFDLEQLKRVLQLVRRFVPALDKTMFVVLLDEYENLFPYQQQIVNGFVKLGPPYLSVKVAKKLGSGDSSGTTAGQDLQETHDYTRLCLVYDVADKNQRRAYRDLLEHVVINIFRSENLGSADINQLLPRDNSQEAPEDLINGSSGFLVGGTGSG